MDKLGWNGPVIRYIKISISEFIESLEKHNLRCVNVNPSFLQIKAWENEYKILQTELPLLLHNNERAADWFLVFEYELPRERGRRPDILIIAEDRIFIIECKDMKRPEQQHIDQLKAYVRDLSNYHAGSHNVQFEPLLLMTLMGNTREYSQGVTTISPDQLHDILNVKASRKTIDPEEWINSRYAPLPSLISAAKLIFENEPLPQIRKAESLGVNDAVNELMKIAKTAQQNNEKHLALVTGVPGSGKTLVGLQLVHQLQSDYKKQFAVFLSGNGPLVKVLQHTLKSKVFVQDVHGFLKEYGGNNTKLPDEKVIIFDEAQRAWDTERAREMRGIAISEPMDFLTIGAKRQEGTLNVGLIGEGQEIHLGEEGGLKQWNDAIAQSNANWIVHCPEKIAHLFTDAIKVVANESLNLTVTLRSHLVEDVDKWVEALLDGDLKTAREYSINIDNENFNIYVTQDIDVAKRYALERYNSCEDKRYGLICSAKAKNLAPFGVDNDFYSMQRLSIGSWFNDPPGSLHSSCSLRLPTTEFQCQGLELDLPIVCWGDDFYYSNGKWISKGRVRYKSNNPFQVTKNCYRVLLTRGRDGMIIFVPPEGTYDTFNAIVESGAKILYGYESTDFVGEHILSVTAFDIKRDEQ
ncbi:MAG: DNA/RNA helicase domain-containing protein [Methanomassiliicoccales archaeon]